MNRLLPIPPAERIQELDVLRGVGILGILLMNIQAFSMIEAAYINPMAYGDMNGLNKWVWIIIHIFADQKFITIFSMLFGAGIVIMAERATAKGLKPVTFHYRRTIWLLIFGLAHAYLLWHGDILVTYAISALWVYLFCNREPRILLIWAGIFILIPALLYLASGVSMPSWPEDTVRNTLHSWLPDADIVTKEITAYRGGWIAQMEARVPSSLAFQTFLYVFLFGWRTTGVMLLGMALYKWGILTGKRRRSWYRTMALAGMLVGVPLIIIGVIKNFNANWDVHYSMFLGWQFNYWGSLGMALAYVALIILWAQSGFGQKIRHLLATVGRTAFSNYLLQTLICTTLFYGHGFGLFGKIDRIGQLVIVIGIWIFQLIATAFWVKYFRFGPAEWLWRSLTYGKMQPLKGIPG
ncbi:DUF418 domain-containing protein [candidate division KSB1 bacterium]|nr:DUF418 domain-containing protein [candidate division KSB1 bacterium]